VYRCMGIGELVVGQTVAGEYDGVNDRRKCGIHILYYDLWIHRTVLEDYAVIDLGDVLV